MMVATLYIGEACVHCAPVPEHEEGHEPVSLTVVTGHPGTTWVLAIEVDEHNGLPRITSVSTRDAVGDSAAEFGPTVAPPPAELRTAEEQEELAAAERERHA